MKIDENFKKIYQEERDKLSPLPDADTDYIALENTYKRIINNHDSNVV